MIEYKDFFTVYMLMVLFFLFGQTAFSYQYDVSGSVQEKYDNNINMTGTDKEDDIITSFMLGLGISHQGRRDAFRLAGSVNQEIYAKNPEESNNAQKVQAEYKRDISKQQGVNIADAFTHVPSAETFQDYYDRAGNNEEYYSNTLRFSYWLFLNQYLKLNLGYQNTVIYNSSEELEDSVAHSGTLGADIYFNAYNILTTSYLYKHNQIGPDDTTTTQSFNLGYRHFFTKQLLYVFSCGIDMIENPEDKYTNYNINTYLQDSINKRLNLLIGFLRKTEASAGSTSVENTWNVRLEGDIEVTKRVHSQCSLFYGERETVESGENVKITGSSLSLQYLFTEKIRSRINYTFLQNNSSLEGNISRHTFMIGFTAIM